MLVTVAVLRLCNIKISLKDSILLNSYTAVINFFGPLQSGPAFRAVYVKKKFNLSLKKYAIATIVYYFFFALFSGIFLISGILKWWLVPLIILFILCSLFVIRTKRFKERFEAINLKYWYLLALATFLQVAIVSIIYFVELHTLSPSITFSQAIIYTGAANFALFVSITPGAIGFREAFLVFTRRLSHVTGGLIVSANILDRAMYLLFLLFLVVLILATHAKEQLDTKNDK